MVWKGVVFIFHEQQYISWRVSRVVQVESALLVQTVVALYITVWYRLRRVEMEDLGQMLAEVLVDKAV